MSAQSPIAIEIRGLSKRFGSVQANADISLRVGRGTIHAIIGENGAGKSTAMKMLYGMVRPDSGEIRVDGTAREWSSPAQAISAGIGMVHQHFMLAGPYTALENTLLGAEDEETRGAPLPSLFRYIDRARARGKLKALAARFGFDVDWDAPVESLPVGVQQRIEILKLLYRNASILILDEPTAVLTPQETQELFVNLRKLKAEGKTILIITHKLKEVMAISDDVTVFRAGRVVGERKTGESSVQELAELMVGRKVSLQAEVPPQRALGAPALSLKGVSLLPGVYSRAASAHGPGQESESKHKLKDLSFEVRAGEVVGIAGVEGNGQSELLQLLIHPRDYLNDSELSGSIECLGRELLDGKSGPSTREVRDLGVGLIPEDRHREGLLLDRPAAESFLLGLQRRKPFSRSGLIASDALGARLAAAMETYDVRPRDPSVPSRGFSGGNQQKLIIARELEMAPKLLIAAQPTRGVDVGAIEFIHQRILAARTQGMAVLLVSSELDEILALSDRILVMYDGRIVGEFARGEADEQKLGLLMGGAALGAPGRAT